MLRVCTFLLCLFLAVASASRYRAEIAVRQTRAAITATKAAIAEEERRIQILRAELAYLENPERLAKIASDKTDLEPLTGDQLVSASEFLTAMGAQDIVRGAPGNLSKTAELTE
ncbi:MAG: hypothetical protein AAFW83_02020 [Pseudomonadota bacterium]